RRDGVRAVGAIKNNFTKRRGVRERADFALPPTERSHSCPASLLAFREPIMIWWPTLTSFVATALPTMPVPRIAIFICGFLYWRLVFALPACGGRLPRRPEFSCRESRVWPRRQSAG